MLAESGWLDQLQENAFPTMDYPMRLYGDPACPHRVHLEGPFRNAQNTAEMHAFNTSMSSVRGSVEWLFGTITYYFKFMDFENLKIGLSSVGKFYLVSALMKNSLTCL